MTRSRVAIIEAPSVLGLFPKGVETLPDALREAGLAERLEARRAGRVEPPPYDERRAREGRPLHSAIAGARPPAGQGHRCAFACRSRHRLGRTARPHALRHGDGAGEQGDVASMRVSDGDRVDIERLSPGVIDTSGHTDDSYCFTMGDRVFTGDTRSFVAPVVPISRTATPRAVRVDLQPAAGAPRRDTRLSGADYKGETVSTIGEERAFNPRLGSGRLSE